MKRLITEIVFGRARLASGVIATLVVVILALGCNNISKAIQSSKSSSNSASPSGVVPPDSEVEALVKKTTAEFADAVQSGDFTPLYNDASEDFRNTYTVDQTKAAFQTYLDKKAAVTPILEKVPSTPADFTKPSAIRTEQGLDILVTEGKFDTKPYNVRFQYEYVKRDDAWKLLKLVINIP